MTKRCSICGQPIHNTPYHSAMGNQDRCQKHCNCGNCEPPATQDANLAAAENEGLAPVLGLLATELISDALSTDSATPATTPDAPATDFSGFDGGSSGGGGATGDF